MRVVPTYNDLYEDRASKSRLDAIIQRYSIFEWLSILSRIQAMIAPPFESDTSRHRRLFTGVMGRRTRERFAAFGQKLGKEGARCLTFAEPQVATLQQYVVLTGSEREQNVFCDDDSFDDLCDALLMTWALMHEGTRNMKGINAIAALFQDQLRRSGAQYPVLIARAFFVYQLFAKDPSPSLVQLRSAFEVATGVRLSDYVLGGLRILIDEGTRDPSDIAKGWFPAPTPRSLANTKDAECLEAFFRLRCANLDVIREEIRKYDGNRFFSDYTFIACSRYPLIDFGDQGCFVLNGPRLAESIFEGVRYSIISAHQEAEGKHLSPQQLGGIYGTVIEEYILDLLARAFPGRYWRIPRSDKKKQADCIIIGPDQILVIEIKSAQRRAVDRTRALTLTERVRELIKLQLPKAARQISSTVESLRLGELELPCQFDWTVTRIVPIVILEEELPLMGKSWPIFESIMSPVFDVPMQELIARPRFITLEEAERLPDMAKVCDLAKECLRWAYDDFLFEYSIKHYFWEKKIGYSNDLLKERYATVVAALAERLGLDKSKLRPR